MFHWICPECGHEIPPSVKECPACDPKVAAAAVSPQAPAPPPIHLVSPPPIPVMSIETEPLEPMLALAESIRAAQVPVLELVAEKIAEPVPPVAAIEPAVETAPIPVVEPVTAAPPLPPALPAPVVEVPLAIAEPAPLLAPSISPDEIQTMELPIPAMRPPSYLLTPPPLPLAAVVPAMPEPPAAAPELPVPVAIPEQPVAAAPEPVAPIAELPVAIPEIPAPVATAPEAVVPVAIPEVPAQVALPELPVPVAAATEPIVSIAIPEIPVPVATAPEPIEPVGSVLAEPVAIPEPPAPHPAPALSVEGIKPEPTAPKAPPAGPPLALDLAASSAELPSPDQPPSGSWLQLAGLQDYKVAARRAMQPAAPPPKIMTPDSGPRITLPGPALPPSLHSLQNAKVSVVPTKTRREKRGLPGWAVSMLFVIGIPAFGAALLFYFMPLGRSNAETKAPVPEPETAVVQASSHPLAQSIEVTGFRFIVDLNKKSEIHYLVVNHSPAALTDMTIYVTLRSADAKPGQPPVCRFSFRAPTLAPFESKEMTSPIEKLTRPVALPEWQDLRSDVQVAQ